MIGVIPAAGNATRLMGIPKSLLPIGGNQTLIGRLIGLMQAVGPHRIAIGSKGTTYQLLDSMFGDETLLYRADTETMSQTVLAAQRFAYDSEMTMLGLPDTYIEDEQAFPKLQQALWDGADVAVGLFQTRPEQHKKLGMCRIEGGRVIEVVDKPSTTDLKLAWGVLAWKPTFWELIDPDDPHVGYALPRAIAAGCDVRAVVMAGQYFDCGDWWEFAALTRHLTSEKVTP